MARPPRLNLITFFTCVAAGALLIAWGHAAPSSTTIPQHATARLLNLKNQQIGTAIFTQTPEGVRIQIDATDLPEGELAFHIHEKGMCDAKAKFDTAGGHFNPTQSAHGHLHEGGAHAGDMMNLKVGRDGVVNTSVMNTSVSLAGSGNGILDLDGSALVIHAKPDDYTSQPSGAAGDRIVCGIVVAH